MKISLPLVATLASLAWVSLAAPLPAEEAAEAGIPIIGGLLGNLPIVGPLLSNSGLPNVGSLQVPGSGNSGGVTPGGLLGGLSEGY